jgi:lipoic acid synthetase
MRDERRPDWLRRSIGSDASLFGLRRTLRRSGLATVCESASCPNRGECWSRGFLTVMILGDVCTRACRFCGVSRGSPAAPDLDEPARVAALLAGLKLRYVVLTSVDRDDLDDGGAGHWAATIEAVKAACPSVMVEALIPDFRGSREALRTVLASRPDVLAHNVETVASLQSAVRPQADYRRSLSVLVDAAADGFATKSGFMVGLGETIGEVRQTLRDLVDAGVSMVTVGQYLQPARDRLPVSRYWAPAEFEEIRTAGVALGLEMQAGPFVRSSYRADAAVNGTAA